MKRFLPVLMGFVFLLLSSTEGWSLPPCSTDIDVSNWTNCSGTLTYANGDKYVGEFKDGKLHGQGTGTFPNGDKYVGEHKDNKLHGQGTYTWGSGGHAGSKYVGEWKDGSRNGQGTFTYADGTVEEGIWENNKFLYAKKLSPTVTAQKTLTNDSSLPPCQGSYYRTTWTDCVGTYTSASGNKYVGEWKYDKYHGQGTLTDALGSKYVGEFKDEWRHGQGTFTSASGSKYVGEWRDNKKHGQGTYTYADGTVTEGIWENSRFLYAKKPSPTVTAKKLSPIVTARTLSPTVIAKKPSPTVTAQKIPTKGSSLPPCPGSPTSSWNIFDSWMNCFGTVTSTTGMKYVGEWKGGFFHGQGTYTFADGTVEEGIFENGALKSAKKLSPTVTAKKLSPIVTAKKPSPTVIGTSEKTPKTKPKRNIFRSPSVIGTSEKTPKVDQQKRLELARRTQEALKVLGLYSGKLDGIIGVITKSAIQRWQQRNGYTGTGEVTELQLAKLEREAITHLATKKSKPTVTAKKIEPKPVQRVAKRPDDIAVIIANSNYRKLGKDIPDVTPAYNDAENIKKYFMESLGVREGNIIYLKDATGAQLTEVFGNKENHKAQLFNWVRPNKSNVYIYYAGHGAPASKDGSAYLVPSDAKSQTIEFSGYLLTNLYRNLNKIRARSVTVILEACFSGFSQGGTVLPRSSGIMVVAREPTVPSNVKVISAGAADQMASWEEDGSQSLFTKYFLKGMSGEGDKKPYGNGDGKVEDRELKKYLDDTMTYYARRYYGRDQTAQIVVNGKELSPTN